MNREPSRRRGRGRKGACAKTAVVFALWACCCAWPAGPDARGETRGPRPGEGADPAAGEEEPAAPPDRAGPAAGAGGGNTVTQWSVFEKTLYTSNLYSGPQKYLDVTLSATFTSPDGETACTVPGFWDGGNVWRVRFAPRTPGRWRYTIQSSDDEMDGPWNDGAFLCEAPTAGEIAGNPNLRGFLKVSANRRYLEYADGTPFFWLGDAIWDGNSAAMAFDEDPTDVNGPMGEVPEFRYFVDDRRSKRFSLIQLLVGVPEVDFIGARTPGTNEGGHLFLSRYDEINPRNFQWLDKRIDYIADSGLAVFLFGSWMPYDGFRMSPRDLKHYWRYLVARYQAHNVVWCLMGEYNSADDKDVLRDLGNYVDGLDASGHLTTIHPGPCDWHPLSNHSSSEHFHGEPWLDLHTQQTWDTPSEHFYLLRDYHLPHPAPVVNSEAGYVGLFGCSGPTVRRDAWAVYTAGAAGYSYGAHGIEQWNDGKNDDDWESPRWYEVIDHPSSFEMKHLANFFSQVPWWTLAPRDDLVSQGFCLAEEGVRYVVYLGPVLGETTVHGLPDRYGARWYDPREGAFRQAWGGPTFAKPGLGDWVLLVSPAGDDAARAADGASWPPDAGADAGAGAGSPLPACGAGSALPRGAGTGGAAARGLCAECLAVLGPVLGCIFLFRRSARRRGRAPLAPG